jgi:hypothetical protein
VANTRSADLLRSCFKQNLGLDFNSKSAIAFELYGPVIQSHIVLADEHGKIIGGHLFSKTIIFAGEIDLQEMTGKPLKRVYDNTTGLMLWNLES